MSMLEKRRTPLQMIQQLGLAGHPLLQEFLAKNHQRSQLWKALGHVVWTCS